MYAFGVKNYSHLINLRIILNSSDRRGSIFFHDSSINKQNKNPSLNLAKTLMCKWNTYKNYYSIRLTSLWLL